jgi:hypothetical protein
MRVAAHPVTHENPEFWFQVAIGIGFLYSLQLPIAMAIPIPIPMANGIDDCFIFEAGCCHRFSRYHDILIWISVISGGGIENEKVQ